MNPQMKQERKLRDKIKDCARRGDFINQIKYQKQLDALLNLQIVELRHSLYEFIKDRTDEERTEITTRVIYAIAIADMLDNATREVEFYLRMKCGIESVPLLGELRKATAILAGAVKTIDDVNDEFFSDGYMEVVDEIETKYEATMKNYILNTMLKRARQKSSKKAI